MHDKQVTSDKQSRVQAAVRQQQSCVPRGLFVTGLFGGRGTIVVVGREDNPPGPSVETARDNLLRGGHAVKPNPPFARLFMWVRHLTVARCVTCFVDFVPKDALTTTPGLILIDDLSLGGVLDRARSCGGGGMPSL